ncbi:hypothetical protein ACIP39_11825 [Streptomyces tibetensis]|uniref:hypothetical protein n=1 Tax=Streptomyces tibetensis TaxID=2382123 RepID=UPI003801FF17
MYGETAANAERRATRGRASRRRGASPDEIHTLVAAIQAGAVEGAHREVIGMDTRTPSGSGDQVHEDWLRAVEAIASSLTHIADRTVRHAESKAAALETPPLAPSQTAPCSLPTAVNSMREEQVQRVLEAAETIFVSLRDHTSHTEIISVAAALLCR